MAAKPLLVATEPFRSAEAKAALARRFRVASSGSGATALYVKLKRRVDARLLDRHPGLRWLVSPTTGLTHVDLAACRARGIEVISLRGETRFLDTISSTAELAWGLLLAAERRIPEADASVRGGAWNRDLFPGRELRGKTLGVVGLGRLGTMVARYGQAFGMKVVYAEPRRVSLRGATRVSLRRLCADSDVISLHVHASPETAGLLGRAEFAAMRRRPLIVNTARGELIDEKALLAALKSGRVRGAALDVLAGEHAGRRDWPKGDALFAWARRAKNVILTPHVGGLTDAAGRAELFAARKLLARL